MKLKGITNERTRTYTLLAHAQERLAWSAYRVQQTQTRTTASKRVLEDSERTRKDLIAQLYKHRS